MNKDQWKEIGRGVWQSIGNDKLTLVSAGMAYYLLLGLFPSLIAFVLIFGILADPIQVQEQIQQLGGLLPAEISTTIVTQVKSISTQSGQAGFGAVISILIAIWSGSKAAKALVQALNIAYNEEESRGFFQIIIIGLGLTLCSVFTGIVTIGLLLIIPLVMSYLQLGSFTAILIEMLRWSFMVLLFMTILAFLYRFAPDRKPPQWKWVTPGAVMATILWVLASWAFSYYVSNFGHYSEVYGSFGSPIIFLLWLYISSFLVLFGAEFNQQIEETLGKEKNKGR